MDVKSNGISRNQRGGRRNVRKGRPKGRSGTGNKVPRPRTRDYLFVAERIPARFLSASSTFTSVTKYQGSTVVQAANAVSVVSFNFQVNSLANVGSWAAIFDQYRIDAAMIEFVPRQNSRLVSVAGDIPGELFTVLDYDDSTTLSSAATAEQYPTCQIVPCWDGVVRYVVPRVAVAAYSGAFSSYGNVPSLWIDAASLTVQHYGVKALVTGGQIGQTLLSAWETFVTLRVTWRNQKGT